MLDCYVCFDYHFQGTTIGREAISMDVDICDWPSGLMHDATRGQVVIC